MQRERLTHMVPELAFARRRALKKTKALMLGKYS
jgi:hypothetical protein